MIMLHMVLGVSDLYLLGMQRFSVGMLLILIRHSQMVSDTSGISLQPISPLNAKSGMARERNSARLTVKGRPLVSNDWVRDTLGEALL